MVAALTPWNDAVAVACGVLGAALVTGNTVVHKPDYGLAATVLTASIGHARRAWRELPVGTVKINNVLGGAPGVSAEPRGISGHGHGFGPELLDEMTQDKVVHIGTPTLR